MAKGSKQSAQDINVDGRFKQNSDFAKTDQAARHVRASSFLQEVSSQKPGLHLGRYRAVGVTGVIALLIIAIGWFALSYLTH